MRCLARLAAQALREGLRGACGGALVRRVRDLQPERARLNRDRARRRRHMGEEWTSTKPI